MIAMFGSQEVGYFHDGTKELLIFVYTENGL